MALFWLIAWPARAACPSRVYTVPLGTSSFRMSLSGLAGPGLSVVEWTKVFHGGLTNDAQYLYYQPTAGFWSTGVDSFVIRLHDANKGSESYATVQLTTPTQRAVHYDEDFETVGLLGTNWLLSDPGGQASYSTAAAMNGTYGLHFADGNGPAELLTSMEWRGASGGNNGTRGGYIPPTGGGLAGGALANNLTKTGVIVKSTFDGALYHWVNLTDNGSSISLQVCALDGCNPIVEVPRTAHNLELLRWPPTSLRPAGVGLWIDGLLASQRLNTPYPSGTAEPPPSYSWGVSDCTSACPQLDLDNTSIFDLSGEPREVCTGADDFETGQITGWTLYGAQNLSTSQLAAQDGRYGLRVDLGPVGNSIGGLLMRAADVNHFHQGLRLTVDPNSVAMCTTCSLVLAVGAQNGGGARAWALILDNRTDGYQLRLQVTRNDNSRINKTWNITDQSHTVKVEWQRSTATKVATGYGRLWVDGQLVGDIPNVDNDAITFDSLRIGASAGAGQGSGQVFLDQIEYWTEDGI